MAALPDLLFAKVLFVDLPGNQTAIVLIMVVSATCSSTASDLQMAEGTPTTLVQRSCVRAQVFISSTYEAGGKQ
jgi:hypothetical protein